MVDLTVGELDGRREDAFRRFGQLIDGIVSETCIRHYSALTQEPQLTAKIAEAIERELNELVIDEIAVEVRMQDFPDRGRGSLERLSGVGGLPTEEIGST